MRCLSAFLLLGSFIVFNGSRLDASGPIAAESRQVLAVVAQAQVAAPDNQKVVEQPKTPAAEPKVEAEPMVKAKRKPIYDPKADAKALIAAAVERAQRDHKHVLIKWGGNWCGWCFKLHDVFKENETVQPIVFEEFELVLIDSQSNQDLMKSYGGKDRSYSYPHLTVLDGSGKVLTNQETGSLEIGPKHDPEKVAGFLKKWSHEREDAEDLLAAALKQAGSEDKTVFLQVGTPYCGWCKVLSGFMNERKQTFDQDYVYLKIDTMRMKDGEAVAERFRPAKASGVPWMVILDANGKVLTSSVGPQGNIGYPSSPSEIEHFLTMLQATKKRLTDDDLKAIKQALNAAREERERKSK
jgi:thioredoxin-related protein